MAPKPSRFTVVVPIWNVPDFVAELWLAMAPPPVDDAPIIPYFPVFASAVR
jgi:hypothetical protein